VSIFSREDQPYWFLFGLMKVVFYVNDLNIDGFVKSPSAVLRFIFSQSTYLYVRLIPKDSHALHLELFTLSPKL
jgi:hypothetical protein